tara:strand:- start:1559 stop:3187 length:1629 start_codon:yes stop_codon:yes gene_type:complete
MCPTSKKLQLIGYFFVLLFNCVFSGSSLAQYPDQEHRIIYNSDASNGFAEHWMWSAHLGNMDPGEKKVIIEDAIDEMAAAGVDTLAVVCWEKFMPDLAPSKVCPDTHRLERLQYLDMIEAGLIPLDIMVEQCRRNGIEIIATLRMNDKHASTPPGRFIREHPEWTLNPPQMDYAHEGVHQKLLAFIEELIAAHAVDGIQFDYMRFGHVFQKGKGEANAHLLTNFKRKTRKLLDAAAQRRGHNRLTLSVRVPQTIEECQYLGYDVAAWIREGLVDWIVPSDFFYTDYNTRMEDFVSLTNGTDCKIYGAIHPITCFGDDLGINDLANYRAAARNFYAHGAHGLEAYNYQYHWGRRTGRAPPWHAHKWPAALGYLGKLSNPREIASNDRHYRFLRLWPSAPTAPAPGSNKDERIKLDRSKRNLAGNRRLRVAEDLSDINLRAILQFKAVGLGEEESLLLKFNGTEIPARWIIRQFDKDGQTKWEGRPLEPFYEYTIDLSRGPEPPPVVHGDNEFSVSLLKNTGRSDGMVTIDEVELYVYVRKKPD